MSGYSTPRNNYTIIETQVSSLANNEHSTNSYYHVYVPVPVPTSSPDQTITASQLLHAVENQISDVETESIVRPMTLDELMDSDDENTPSNEQSTNVHTISIDSDSDNDSIDTSTTESLIEYIIDRTPRENNIENENDINMEDSENMVGLHNSDYESNLINEIESNHSSDSEDESTQRGMRTYKPIHTIGLASMSEIYRRKGEFYHHRGKSVQAMEYFIMSVEIDPYSSCSQELATIYEDLQDYDNAVKYYKMAIHYNNDIIAMFNLADLYIIYVKNHHGNSVEYKKEALKYFNMAADMGDNESLEVLCSLSHQKSYDMPLTLTDNDKENDYLPQSVYFAKSFKDILDHKGDHYVWPDEDDEENDTMSKNLYSKFVQDNNILGIMDTLQKVDTSNMISEHKQIIEDCISTILKDDTVIIYKNKVSLFTRLNNITECGICYDEKLNIDLHCGHCVCTDCYSRLYAKACPFCRIESPVTFFS